MEERNLLDYAREGDLLKLKCIVENRSIDINMVDFNGNSALHFAAANGHLDVLRYLLKNTNINPIITNKSGNTALHWALQTKKIDSIKILLGADPAEISDRKILHDNQECSSNSIEKYEWVSKINVLAKNCFGKSILSEAFLIDDEDIINLILQHPSVSSLYNGYETDNNGDSKSYFLNNGSSCRIVDEVVHEFVFSSLKEIMGSQNIISIFCREIGLSTAPLEEQYDLCNDNSTGVSLWTASLVAAQWLATLALSGKFKDKSLIELGAGCGLPGITLFKYAEISGNSIDKIFFSDKFDSCLKNLMFNLHLNNLNFCEHEMDCENTKLVCNNMEKKIHIVKVDFGSTDYYIDDIIKFDVIIGSELVYDAGMKEKLVSFVSKNLSSCGKFYYVHRHQRLGAMHLVEELKLRGMKADEYPAPEEFYENCLRKKSQEVFNIHFNEAMLKDVFLLTAERV